MVRESPNKHTRENIRPLENILNKRYWNVQLFLDMFYINKNVFLHTKSENINYRSVQALNRRDMTEVAKGLNLVRRKYEKRGLKKQNRYNADSELDNTVIQDMFAPAIVDIYENKEYVGVIKRSIREIKERA